MLTKSHHAARKFVKHAFRPHYRQHMCGLCHALGDEYGLASRLLTSHDVILLNLLTSAQMPAAPAPVIRRCPLNPRFKVQTNQDDGSRFAAAVAVELANISVQDDISDSPDLRARFAARMLKGLRQRAQSSLESLDFDTTPLTRLNARQDESERDITLDPAQPTAEVSAALFVMTARLANRPENELALAEIGASYGAYLYLSDAFRDYADDAASGAYNPLKRTPQRDNTIVQIPQESLTWLFERLHQLLATLRASFRELTLLRYEAELGNLLAEPIERLIAQVRAQRETPIIYRQWRWQEALRAALFIMPVPEQGLLFSEAPPPTKRKRDEVVPDGSKADTGKKKRKRVFDDYFCCDNTNTQHSTYNTSCYWCPTGCGDDDDRDGCECGDTCNNDGDSAGLLGCIGGDGCDLDCDGCDGGCDGCCDGGSCSN